jgi:SAM-dependent MidA family methyltransferase
MSLPTANLKERLASLIAAQGPIGVAQFMTIALHDPQSGYYATRDPFGPTKVGKKGGDFTTAPEISQMFGEMLGLWLAQAWDDQGRPGQPLLVELGPGRGTLMADMLRAAKAMPGFLKEADIVMVEASPHLRAVQQEKLADHKRITWQSQFDPPAGRPIFLVANEFFDALPIRQYVKTARGWCERMVTLADGALAFALAPTPAPGALIPESRADAPEGGIYETAPAAIALAEEIARRIAAQGGAALLVDYGYQAIGFGETLQAVGGHAFAGLLAQPGDHDLSAHVDFGALAMAGKRGGAGVHGPIGQGALLAALGIAARAQALMAKNPASAADVSAALSRLTAPDQMGTLFKALAFLPPGAARAPGFDMENAA